MGQPMSCPMQPNMNLRQAPRFLCTCALLSSQSLTSPPLTPHLLSLQSRDPEHGLVPQLALALTPVVQLVLAPKRIIRLRQQHNHADTEQQRV